MKKQLHYPVLLNESIDLLNIKPDGVYVDGTFGRGGHTKAVLAKLNENGIVIAYDKDIEAVNYANNLSDKRLKIVHDSFVNFDKYLVNLGVSKIDGVLLDLGVSSPQLESKERGFSFRFDADLDMRMDNTCGQSAKEWINLVDEVKLADVLWKYGDEKFSRKIAKSIVEARSKEPIFTTTQLADIIRQSISKIEKGQHPATRSFQAIRIFINNELSDLEVFLDKVVGYLHSGSRLVVISFHSLEDRIVKNKFNGLSNPESIPKWINKVPSPAKYKVVAKKIRASLHEVSENIRSRSAVLRCLEKI